MRCEEARRAILEADGEELAGRRDGPLPTHIRECPRCRAAAETVRKDQDALGAALINRVPAPDLDSILDRALSPEAVAVQPRFRRLRRAGLALVPLAAAATLATLFLNTTPDLPGDPIQVSGEPAGLDLQAPEGATVAILPTNNPDITVLWFF